MSQNRFPFLAGGGEMGELTRNFNWSSTAIGTPDTWEQSLCTTVGILLNSKMPMFLWWGDDLIQFYNDAYRPSLGSDGKHPTALGARGDDTWPEIWPEIYPIIAGILAGGDSYWSENRLLPIYRNGRLEDVFWTFGYGPVQDDSGAIKGILVTCTETTAAVQNVLRARADSQLQSEAAAYVRKLTDSMPAVLWLTEPDGYCSYLNKQWYEITGQTESEALGFGWISATHPDEQADVGKIFTRANDRHEPFIVRYRLRQSDGSYRWSIDKGTPRFHDSGEYAGMIGTVTDVHEQQESEDLSTARLRESDLKFRSIVTEAPVATCLFTGPDLIIEIANDSMLSLWGKDRSVIGQPLIVGVPELKGQPFIEQLNKIWKTKVAYEGSQEPADLNRDGLIKTYYFDFTYKPLLDADGEIYGIMDMAVDVTEKTMLQKRLEESQKELISYFEQSPVGIAIIKEENLTFTMANPFYGELVGRTPEEIIGKPLLEALPEIRSQGFDILLRDVIKTGVPYIAKEVAVDILRNDRIQTIYVDLAYQPRKEQNDRITGVLVVATDVTEQILSRKKIEESETRFRSLIHEAPVGTCLYVGPEFRVEVANDIIMGYWGKGKEVLGKPMLEVMPELIGQPFPKIISEVYSSGRTYEEKAARANLKVDGELQTFYFDFTYKPLFNENHEVYAVLDMAVDVTAQVIARKELEESETKLRGIISSAPAGIGLFVGRDLIVENPNQTFIDIVGKGPDIVGKPLREVMPELLAEGQPFLQILDDVFTTGVMFQSPGSMVKIVQQGVMTYNYYNITYSPVFDTGGKVYAILDIAIDVTDQIKAQKRLEQAEVALRDAIELAQLGTWSLDIFSGEVSFSDRLLEWFGLAGNSPITTIVPGIHEQDAERVNSAIAKALNPQSDGIFDIEYTAINRQTGQQRIIHIQGKTIFDELGHPLKLNGTSQDITIQRQHQMALEHEVQLRTEQLAAAVEELQVTNEELEQSNDQLSYSNDELAQYAYVASHDLQEPLRKIRVFTSRLITQDVNSSDSKAVISKISAAAERMTLLIQDLLDFSRLLNSDSMLQAVKLTDVVNAVINDFELTISEKNARVTIAPLPLVQAVGLQMNQLFTNLISNSLKFVKPGVSPQLEITSTLMSHEQAGKYLRKTSQQTNYYDIAIRDNGIGFEAEFSEQIFEVFKRLHGREIYPGSGIGLALCRRIAGNHNGFLYAESEIGKGTTFHLILPDKQ